MKLSNKDGIPMLDGSSYVPYFSNYTSVDMYKKDGLIGYDPMTAKEIETEEKQEEVLSDSSYFVEEKFDGTRALLYFLKEKKPEFECTRDGIFRHFLLRGSGFSGGKRRIYEHLLSDTLSVDFLKKEYGIGGFTIDFPDKTRGFADFNSKGCSVRIDNIIYSYPWKEAVLTLCDMYKKGEYCFSPAYTRCFSRRVSEKTGWYCENTDSLPQLREISVPSLSGTIIDGEMFIPKRPFKDVSATLNCKWDKAVIRQTELGFIVFHAFDILFYKGIDVRKLPLHRRKAYLELAVKQANSPYVQMVDTFTCGSSFNKCLFPPKGNFSLQEGNVPELVRSRFADPEQHDNFIVDLLKMRGDKYPELYSAYVKETPFTAKAYYELIVATGGEGVMIKPKDGKYYHKRGREYQKIKKFFTRDVIIMGFGNPTNEYNGKFPTIDKWDYWETREGDLVDLSTFTPERRKQFEKSWYPDMCTPVSKFYYNGWVGNIRFGVIVTPDEIKKLPKNKKFNIEDIKLNDKEYKVLEVGECSGFDEATRKMFSESEGGRNEWVGRVIEVKANEIFKDTGKLRHPRYIRMRWDKSPVDCTYSAHLNL